MRKRVRKPVKVRQAQIHERKRREHQPPDVGLRTGETIAFVGRLPEHGNVQSRRGDGGFRVTMDVFETEANTEAMHRMWRLIQVGFEVHVRPPAASEVAFVATFPDHGTVIARRGDGGCRLTWDVAEEEMAPMALLMTLIQKELNIAVYPRLGSLPEKEKKRPADALPLESPNDN